MRSPEVPLVQAGGYDVALRTAGSGPTTAVLVHGIGVSARYFRPLLRELSRTHRVLAPDLPGFGRSPCPGGVLSVEQHAHVVAALVTRLVQEHGLEPPVLVGHSMGAQVVTECAVASPGLVAGLVLIGPVTDPAADSAVRQGWRLFRDGFREPARVDAIMVGDWLRTGPRRYLATVPTMLEYPLQQRLAEVREAVVLVRGARDPVAPAPFVQTLADAGRRTTVVQVPGEGHVVMYRRPDVVAEVCRSVQ